MLKPEFNDISQLSLARSRVYELLASVYNLLPSAEFLMMVLNQDIRTLLTSVIGDYPASDSHREQLEQITQGLQSFRKQAAEMARENLITCLGVDRTRLFRGVKRGYGPPPPYECIYAGGNTIMGESSMRVKKAYSDAGYQPKIAGNEPPDYVGTELDFLRFLCERETEAWLVCEQSKAQDCRQKQQEFLCNHVVKWVPRFCEEMLTHSREDFYRAMANLTKTYIEIETDRLGNPEG